MKVHFVLPLCLEQFLPFMKDDSLAGWRTLRTRRQGFENFTARLVKSGGHEVFVWLVTDLVNEQTRLVHRDGYTIVLVPKFSGYVNFRYPLEISLPLFLGLKREFGKKNVDIVHLHGYYTAMALPVALLCKLYGKPIISQNHGDGLIGRGLAKLPLGLMSLLAIWLSSRILVINRDEMKNLAAIFRLPMSRVDFCQHGVDTNFFYPAVQERAKSHLGLLSDTKVILFVGRLSDFHKGISYLLRAFKILLRGNYALQLIIVGKGPDEHKLKTLAERLLISKDVLFAGEVPDSELPLYYNASDVVVIPSLFEAFGLVTIEAMSCARPIVASNVGGIKEIIQDGKTGYLIPPGNAEAIAKTVSSLLDHPEECKRLGSSARREVELKYSLVSLGGRLEEIYLKSAPKKQF